MHKAGEEQEGKGREGERAGQLWAALRSCLMRPVWPQGPEL